jgi:hypothetical protein
MRCLRALHESRFEHADICLNTELKIAAQYFTLTIGLFVVSKTG